MLSAHRRMSEALLTLTDAAVGYPGATVLAHVNLRLTRGSYTGLLGANGSGKSTLIKTILGILPLQAGRMELAAAGGRPPVLGYVPQRETLDDQYPLSALEVTLMGALGRVRAGRWLPRAERDWARDCLRQTAAEELAGRRFAHLSGGQKQRVLLARALAARPDFLLLDEPTAGIDAGSVEVVTGLLERLNREQGMTILMVNHDLHIVRRHAREVIWLHRGNLQAGPVAELLRADKVAEILELQIA
jgi:ABC-type Mn2+/Zn2+ transport system ATPase subunit